MGRYAAFLTSYRTRCWYYESVMMARRIVLLLVYAFPKSQQLLLRGIISFMCTVILAIHVTVQPFLEPINNYLETALLLLLCLISTLSTINGQGVTNINTTITLLAALPLLPLFYLAPMYCKKSV